MGSTLSDILGLRYGIIYQGILSALKKNIGKLDLDILTENCNITYIAMPRLLNSLWTTRQEIRSWPIKVKRKASSPNPIKPAEQQIKVCLDFKRN